MVGFFFFFLLFKLIIRGEPGLVSVQNLIRSAWSRSPIPNRTTATTAVNASPSVVSAPLGKVPVRIIHWSSRPRSVSISPKNNFDAAGKFFFSFKTFRYEKNLASTAQVTEYDSKCHTERSEICSCNYAKPCPWKFKSLVLTCLSFHLHKATKVMVSEKKSELVEYLCFRFLE